MYSIASITDHKGKREHTMSSINLERLPLASTGFVNLREANKIYVDKTELIYKLTRYDSAPIFLSRPRRFGKSLLVSTFEALFSRGLEDFHGLAIEKLWKADKEKKSYKVLHLDFSEFYDLNGIELNRRICRYLVHKLSNYVDIKVSDDQGRDYGCEELLRIISEDEKFESKTIVLLIDEYDAPIVHAMNDQKLLSEITGVLGRFFAAIKSCEKIFRFVFVTGITRLSNFHLLSPANNQNDISFDPQYASLVGITEKELHYYFEPFIVNASEVLGISPEETYTKLKTTYNGFQFAIEAKETVYNPWSILSFLSKPHLGFKNYWFESNGGTPSLLVNHLKQNYLETQFLEKTKKDNNVSTIELEQKSDINRIPLDILLYQTGYYTLRNIGTPDFAKLEYPNEEVESSIIQLKEVVGNFRISADTSVALNQNLIKYVDEKNLEGIRKLFNSILTDCLGPSTIVFNSETDVRDIIYSHINLIGLLKSKEQENLYGYSDLELKTPKTRLVIEFKRIKKDKLESKAREKAKAQIKEKAYGEDPYNHTHVRASMIISSEQKKIIKVELV